jgi:virginiamycin A acetyltransferase
MGGSGVRRLANLVLNVIGVLFALPFILWTRLVRGLLRSQMSYTSSAYFLGIMPGVIGMAMRRAFYCTTLAECRWDLVMHFGSVITHSTARIGPRVWIGAYSLIGRCHIEGNVIVGSRVSVVSGRYPHRFGSVNQPINEQGGEFQEITIGEDTWLGEGSIVMSNVGKHCVVGAGSIVVKPVEPLLIVAGNPARQIGTRGDA